MAKTLADPAEKDRLMGLVEQETNQENDLKLIKASSKVFLTEEEKEEKNLMLDLQ